jgi:hypothetical protein
MEEDEVLSLIITDAPMDEFLSARKKRDGDQRSSAGSFYFSFVLVSSRGQPIRLIT